VIENVQVVATEIALEVNADLVEEVSAVKVVHQEVVLVALVVKAEVTEEAMVEVLEAVNVVRLLQLVVVLAQIAINN
jgi:hypothetical protein